MDIRQFSVKQTARVVIKTADGKPMLDSKGKELAVNLYGPASKQFANAKNAYNARALEKLRAATTQTTEQATIDTAEFLAQCTHSFENVEVDDLKGDELAKAVYSNPEIGFVSEQINKHLGDWANFLPTATKS